MDPSWCRIQESTRGREQGDFGPSPVRSYPVDESPFGVRGMGGNVEEWCLDLFEGPSLAGQTVRLPKAETYAQSRALRVVRGGAWDTNARMARVCGRGRREPDHRRPGLGFRGVFSVETDNP